MEGARGPEDPRDAPGPGDEEAEERLRRAFQEALERGDVAVVDDDGDYG